MAVLVTLSSGDTFYVDGDLDQVEYALRPTPTPYFVRVGSRFVNPAQVAQMFQVHEVPSIHTPEHLED